MVCSIGPGIDKVDSASTADVVRKLNAQKNWFSKGFAPNRLIVVRQKGKAVGEVSAVIMAETAAKIELRFTCRMSSSISNVDFLPDCSARSLVVRNATWSAVYAATELEAGVPACFHPNEHLIP